MEKRTIMIGVKVSPETRKKIEYISEREQRTMSSIINIWIEEKIKEYQKKEKIEFNK